MFNLEFNLMKNKIVCWHATAVLPGTNYRHIRPSYRSKHKMFCLKDKIDFGIVLSNENEEERLEIFKVKIDLNSKLPSRIHTL